MPATGVVQALAVLQLVAAGLSLSLALTSARSHAPDRRWLSAWQVMVALVFGLNYLLFVTSGSAFEAVMLARASALSVEVVVIVGFATSFAQRPAPGWVWSVAAAQLVARVALWPTTDLFYVGQGADGLPDYGPLLPVVNGLSLLLLGSYVIHALATSAPREERGVLTAGFGLTAVLIGASLVTTGPSAELLAAYQALPSVLALQVVYVRRTRATESALRRFSRQRARLADLARELQGAADRTSGAELAARATTEMLDAGHVVVEVDGSPPVSLGWPPTTADASEPADLSARHATVTVHAWRRASFEPSELRLADIVADVVYASVERLRVEDKLRHRALYDELTGLANRTLLVERLGAAITRSRRSGASVAVLFCDLDGFKDVNDEHGHPTGDALLAHVARRLLSVARSEDTVARFGGDEFVVVCEDLPVESLPEVANRVLTVLNDHTVVGERPVRLAASIGVAVSEDGDDPDALLRDADTAMYRAKELGGGRLEVFDASLRSILLHRIDLGRRIVGSAARGEIVLHYQPIVRLADGLVSHVEALSRWQRDGRLTPPDEWIPVAEHTGAIDEIGAWVLGEATRRLAHDNTLGLTVNVSPHQLRSAAGIRQLVAAVHDAAIEPSRIWLEITESAVTPSGPGVAELSAMRELGVSVAIDDFGTGYSSLSALARLPVDVVKIDKSFVHRLSDPEGRAVVRAVVQLGRDLSRAVVAEGIETDEQLRILQDLECTYGQGFLLGRPVSEPPCRPDG